MDQTTIAFYSQTIDRETERLGCNGTRAIRFSWVRNEARGISRFVARRVPRNPGRSSPRTASSRSSTRIAGHSVIGVNFPPEFDRLRETDAIVSVDVSTRRNQASGLIGRSLTVRSLRIKSRFIGGRGENSRVFNQKKCSRFSPLVYSTRGRIHEKKGKFRDFRGTEDSANSKEA